MRHFKDDEATGGATPYLRAKDRAEPLYLAVLRKIATNGDRMALREFPTTPDLTAKDLSLAIATLQRVGFVEVSGPPLDRIAILTEAGRKELGLPPVASSLPDRPQPSAQLGDTIRDELQDLVEQQFKKVLAGPVLANYQGSVFVRILSSNNPILSTRERVFRVPAGSLKLAVFFAPFAPSKNDPGSSAAEVVKISGGEDRREVLFQLELESDTLSFKPQIAVANVVLGEQSKPIEFTTTISGDAIEHSVWLQVFQQNRLVQTVEVHLLSDPKDVTNG